jgi:hypothetical protein
MLGLGKLQVRVSHPAAELMRLHWALAHLRQFVFVDGSDQGEGRTPMPLRARRSERRVSASFTTWSRELACLLE